jgi:hypothetical protein
MEQVVPRSRQEIVMERQDFLSEAMFTESFGDALRAAIKIEFGTQKAFAEALFVDKSRISQLISGREIPSPQTLESLLKAFTDWSLRERVYAAWTRACQTLPDIDELMDAGAAIIGQIRKLIDSGQPIKALKLAYKRRAAEPFTSKLWLELSEEIVEGHLKLREYGTALRQLALIKSRAAELHDMGGVVTASWMSASAFRALDMSTDPLALQAEQDANAAFASWKPVTEEDRALKDNRYTALARDFGLGILHRSGFQPLDQAQYELARGAVDKSMTKLDSTAIELAGKQVLLRLELAAGHVFKAEEILEELVSKNPASSSHEAAKLDQVRAEILLARGQREEAIELLESLSRNTLSRMNLHLQGRLQRTLAMAVLKKR